MFRFFKTKLGLAFLWCVFIISIFNYYAYEVEAFNAAVRVFAKSGSADIRSFDERGLAISNSPRIGTFISPFYVVHYGLIYSDGLMKGGEHWHNDPSIAFWNVHPPKVKQATRVEFFRNSADWLVSNVTQYNGYSHFVYDFDWPYKNYPNGYLKSPWWSGLTDGYAIILLLRAHDYFGDDRYLALAESLYRSVLAPTDAGGSLSELNGCPWIEEYVDPRVHSSQMSFVLNGMVYASYGISAFEKYTKLTLDSAMSDKLLACIEENINIFDKQRWSYYDAIKNSANIKYHAVNYALVRDLKESYPAIFSSNNFKSVVSSWEIGLKNSGFFYIIEGPKSLAYYHFLLMLIVAIGGPLFLLFWLPKLRFLK